MKRRPLLALGCFAALTVSHGSAFAQGTAGMRAPVDPEPPPASSAAPPPAAAPPAPAPVAAPAPAAEPNAAEPAVASVAEPDEEADDDDQHGPDKHKKNKKHKSNKKKHKHEHDARQAADDDERPEHGGDHSRAPHGEYDGVVFNTSGGSVALKGRIFALAELAHREETVVGSTGELETRDRNSLDLSLASARFGLQYRSPLRWLSADLELEVAGKPQIKDAFILAGKRFFVKAGQFKIPTAELELESPWALPLVRRGLVHDLLSDWLDVGSRRPGVALGYRGKGSLKPRLTLGAFQGTTLDTVTPGDRNVDLIDHASVEAQSFAARAELSVAFVDLGVWYEQRVGSQITGEFSHFATLGLDASIDHKFESSALRLWVDGLGGQSLYVNADKPPSSDDPLFAVGRALVGYRFGGLELGAPYVEPFGFFALLDPDLEVVADQAVEGAVGINAGFWDRARVTLQGELTHAQRNFPVGFLDNQDPDHMSVLLQAGARF